MSWRCLTSELRLNTKAIEFLSSFFRNVVREDQFQLLDLRHLHFFNSTHPIAYISTLKTAFKCTTNIYLPLCKSDRKLSLICLKFKKEKIEFKTSNFGSLYLSEYLTKLWKKNSFGKPGVSIFYFLYSLWKIQYFGILHFGELFSISSLCESSKNSCPSPTIFEISILQSPRNVYSGLCNIKKITNLRSVLLVILIK
jgi:hypothetical protein